MSDKDQAIRVVSAVADKHKVVLYKEDGDTLIINQGDHRLAALLDEIIPITTKGQIAVVSLSKFSVYADVEQRSNGVIKLFRVAKTKLASWFKGRSPEEVTITGTPKAVEAVPDAVEKTVDPAAEPEVVNLPPVLEDLQEDLMQINERDEVSESEAVVAVVDGKVIPDVDKIKPILEHASRTNSTVAVENFMKRVAAMVETRKHSVQDLMTFLEKGDLPLAEDGSIIAYKILRRMNGRYVDCYSGKVPQGIGSYVCVKPSLVDLSRHNECSNGLHIARRSYIGSFSGDVCTLCKIDPEDVMVVPHGDPNKIRVKGYHILAELSQAAYNHLRANKPMTTEVESLRVVYEAIKGNHTPRTEKVEIGGQRGTNVVVTPLAFTAKTPTATTVTGSLSHAAALDDGVTAPVSVEPREINKRINEEQAKLAEATLVDEPEVTEDGFEPEYDEDTVEEDNLEPCMECNVAIHPDDLTDGICESCMERMTAPDESSEVSQEDLEAAAEFHDSLVAQPVEPAPVAEPEPKKETQKVSRKDQAQALLKAYDACTHINEARLAAQALVKFRKETKVGWNKLGIADKIAKHIEQEAAKAPGAAKVSGKTAQLSQMMGGKAQVEVKTTKTNKTRAAFNIWSASPTEENRLGVWKAKAAAKKGWEVLGFVDEEVQKLGNKP